MSPTLLAAAADSASPWWVSLIKDVGIPVLGAGLILRWVGTELISVLKALLKGLQDNTAATVSFTSSQREHTATVASALAALKGQVAEVERDVEALDDRLRETTGKHIVPPEFRKKEGG